MQPDCLFVGRQIRVYNLGYPTISLTKDLMVLDYALAISPGSGHLAGFSGSLPVR